MVRRRGCRVTRVRSEVTHERIRGRVGAGKSVFPIDSVCSVRPVCSVRAVNPGQTVLAIESVDPVRPVDAVLPWRAALTMLVPANRCLDMGRHFWLFAVSITRRVPMALR